MTKLFKIDDCAYTLYKAFEDTNAEEVIKESRGYNDGMDFFEGSDCATVTVFLVAKSEVPLFIQDLEIFTQALTKAKVPCEPAESLLELTEYFNFTILHKKIPEAPFDFFVTNFMFDWYPFVDIGLNALSESTGKKLQAISSFSISAGSTYGDASLRAYARAYLVFKGLFLDEYDGLSDMRENYTYEELVPFFNGPAEAVLNAFFRFYFRNIPRPRSVEDSSDVLFRQALNCL